MTTTDWIDTTIFHREFSSPVGQSIQLWSVYWGKHLASICYAISPLYQTETVEFKVKLEVV